MMRRLMTCLAGSPQKKPLPRCHFGRLAAVSGVVALIGCGRTPFSDQEMGFSGQLNTSATAGGGAVSGGSLPGSSGMATPGTSAVGGRPSGAGAGTQAPGVVGAPVPTDEFIIDGPDEPPRPDAICGNGTLEWPEGCDDGNRVGGDGCSADCVMQEPGYRCGTGGCVLVIVCGDAIVSESDEPGVVSESCDDGDWRAGDGCSASCQIEPGFACETAGSACVRTCGDALRGDDEECDDGNLVADDGCSPTCRLEPGFICATPRFECRPACGEGTLQAGEECDDGNLVGSDGCDAQCRVERGYVCGSAGEPCRLASCGDGVAEGGERCDDGNDVDGDGCTSSCQLSPSCAADGTCDAVCGDGIVSASEACDDGNATSGDGCDVNCELESGFECTGAAGNDVVDAGAPNAGTKCSATCGDGVLVLPEVCDDGLNDGAYGGCSADCASWVGCGDGVVNGSEACDDGVNADVYSVNGDGCAPGCVPSAYCGDGIVQPEFEECDLGADNGLVDYNGCTPDCLLGPRCADGTTQDEYEECDDGNFAPRDGCSPWCQLEPAIFVR